MRYCSDVKFICTKGSHFSTKGSALRFVLYISRTVTDFIVLLNAQLFQIVLHWILL
jgi:hypothetical protein